jgi:hypothetical protein
MTRCTSKKHLFPAGRKGVVFSFGARASWPTFPVSRRWPTVNDVSIQRVPPLKLRLGAISVRDCTFTAPSHYGSRRPGRPRPGWRAVLANVLRCSASLGG